MEGRLPQKGFTLVELLVAMVVITSCLSLIAAGMVSLSRFLSRSEIHIRAVSLASEKVLEWQEMLRYGGNPEEWPRSGSFEGNPELSWEADSLSTAIDPSLYELQLRVKRIGRAEPLLSLISQGWRGTGMDHPGKEG